MLQAKHLSYLDLLQALDVDGAVLVLRQLERVPLGFVPLPLGRGQLLQEVVDVLVVDLREADPHRVLDVGSGETDA